MKKIAILITVIIIVLLIPLIFKERGNPLKDFKGVKLEELSYTEVDFVNQNDNLNLAGMLFIPPERDTFPVAIIIHGSGYSSRHNGWYLELTKYLQSNGVAVLLPDKRGSEKSDGEWIGLSIEELATDTEAAISF